MVFFFIDTYIIFLLYNHACKTNIRDFIYNKIAIFFFVNV